MRENLQVNRWVEQRLPKENLRGIILLTGARQTGKTTSVRSLYSGLAYYNLDAVELREQLSAVRSFYWHELVGRAVLDEVQKEPSVLEKVKYAFDAGEVDFSVLLGSAQILLMKKVKETLAGRVFVYELFPLMLSEMLSPRGTELREPLMGRLFRSGDPLAELDAAPEVLLGASGERRRQAEEMLLQWGGMPGLRPLDDVMRRKWLASYEETYLQRDLGDLARLDDLKPFRRFQKLAALRSGQLLSFSELARDAGVAVETARRYMEYLRLSYQSFLLQPFSENLTSQVVKTPKVFWSDCGLLRSMTGRAPDAVVDGHLYETYVASELVKYIRSVCDGVEVFYYRTRSGLEVDFLIQTAHGVLLLEVKSRRQVSKSDIGSMRRVGEALGPRFLGGLVVYSGERIKEVDPGFWAVPSFRLFSA